MNEDEDFALPLTLTNEFFEWIETHKARTASDYNYFLERLREVSPEYRHKFLWNIAQKIQELKSKE